MNCPVKTYFSAMKNSQKSDQNDRKQILNWIFDESDAEIEGIVCCFARSGNIKGQSLSNQVVAFIYDNMIDRAHLEQWADMQ